MHRHILGWSISAIAPVWSKAPVVRTRLRRLFPVGSKTGRKNERSFTGYHCVACNISRPFGSSNAFFQGNPLFAADPSKNPSKYRHNNNRGSGDGSIVILKHLCVLWYRSSVDPRKENESNDDCRPDK